MQLAHYRSRLEKLLLQRNGYLLLSAGCLSLCFLLVTLLFVLAGRDKIILIPPSLQRDTWLSTHHVSPSYLSQLSLFLVELRMNTTPQTIDTQNELLLRYTDPRFYPYLKTELVAQSDHLKANPIITAFFPVDIRADTQKNQVWITGDLRAWMGESALPVRRVTYHLVFQMQSYRPWLRQWEEKREKAHD